MIRSAELLGERLGAGEERLRLRGEELVVRELRSAGAGALEEGPVPADLGEAEVGEAGLTAPEQLARAAQLQIDLRELEPVRRLDHGLQAPRGGLRELLPGPRDEQAVRLLGPPPDAAAQLVQLREPEAVGLLDDHHRCV